MDNEKVLKILLVEDEPAECTAIINSVEKTDGIKLVGVTSSIEKAFIDVKDGLPDAIILDLELHKGEGDGIKFMERLQASDLVRPFILVTTNNSSRIIYDRVRGLGADFIMSKGQKDYSADYVISFLMSMKNTILYRKAKQSIHKEILDLEDREEITRRILKRIDTELDLVGINPKVLGRKYLGEAIQMIMVESIPNFCNIIAKKYGKSAQSIDHAMSNAIKKAWTTSPIEDLLDLYTAKVNAEKGYPTCTEFVHYYARKIKNDL